MGNGLSEKVKVWRWEFIAGICLVNGFRVGAELGVSTGRFTSFLCNTMPDCRMVAVDLWAQRPPRAIEGAQTYEGWPHDENLERFRKHVAEAFPQRVTILRMDTVEAAAHVPDGSLDFVFIDADHTYEGCLRDIKAWTPKVRAGGLIAGHDYNWTSVKRAVDETGFAQLGHDKVWYRLKHKSYATQREIEQQMRAHEQGRHAENIA